MNTRLKKLLVAAAVVWAVGIKLSQAAGRGLDNFGVWLTNVLYYRGKTGQIDFDKGDLYDGFIVVRRVGHTSPLELPFYIENRWVVRDRNPSNLLLNRIITEAMVQGYQVSYIIWDGRQMTPYWVEAMSLRRRPDDVVLPSEQRWIAKQEFPQYDKDPMARNSAIVFQV